MCYLTYTFPFYPHNGPMKCVSVLILQVREWRSSSLPKPPHTSGGVGIRVSSPTPQPKLSVTALKLASSNTKQDNPKDVTWVSPLLTASPHFHFPVLALPSLLTRLWYPSFFRSHNFHPPGVKLPLFT